LRDAILIQGLRLVFGDRTLVDGFNWRVPAGGRCTLTGPSGCGKSTLLKCLLGFERVAAGTIEVLGTSMEPSSVWGLRRQVAWVPQEPELGDGTAREFLGRLFGYRANRGQAERLDRVDALARDFLLDPGLLDQPLNRLSGGEKQRVALISALLLDRPLLLLDEPFSGLDAEARCRVTDRIARMPGTVITVSHEPAGFGVAEQVVALAFGEGRSSD